MYPLRWATMWKVSAWLLVLLTSIVSLVPAPDSVGINNWDKLGHLAIYALLMAWFAGMYRPSRYLVIAVFLILLGGTLEVLQLFSSYRMGDWLDFLANSAGVAIGL
ncbi:MAG: VanZ family protein, partial [Gammaproteobacteria bacterium]